jgi:iron complex outermembrane receptor protein
MIVSAMRALLLGDGMRVPSGLRPVRDFGIALLSMAMLLPAGSAAFGQSSESPASEQTTVILEGIVVTAPRTTTQRRAARGAGPSTDDGAQTAAEPSTIEIPESVNPPAAQVQQERFVRRPGAEVVVPVAGQEPGRLANPGDVLPSVPGVFVTERGAGSSAFISMRGSDIATDGSRNGRGIRAYLDGIPLGRTEAGLTNQLIDMSTVDYLEVYRGGNSLRYGAIATGGALNFVSKTGRSAPGTALAVSGGSFGNIQTQLEHGGAKGAFDWYLQGNMFRNGGYVHHTDEENYRFSGNFGWRPNADVESRTYFAIGRTNMDMGDSIPLDQLEAQRRGIASWGTFYNARLDFEYQRLANRTTIRDGNSTYELGAYFLNTALDHLPVPMAGIIDYGWKEGGVSGRVEHKTTIAGLPTELVAGVRISYTAGDFNRFRHLNQGRDKGQQIYDWDFASWLVESYAESAIEILPRVRLFTGLQGVYTTRELDDQYRGGAVAPVNPMGPPPQAGNPPQPGRTAALLEYDRDFQALNPKLGLNWEYTRQHFLFANVTRSFEVPSGADFANVFTVAGAAELEAQSAWTWEVGTRGGWERFKYDLTLYHMRLRNEILTRCANTPPAPCTSSNTVAFNADRTIHDGVEFGVQMIPFVDVFSRGDGIFANFVWNYTNFRFDDDAVFGDERMPVIPAHQLFGEVGYRHTAGFFASVNVRYVGERRTTFDGSGGDAFMVPDYTLFGAKIGWQAPDKTWSVFLEGRNLTDEAYVSDFAASPTVLRTGGSPMAPLATSPSVRPGDGRAIYGGFSVRF